MNTLLADPSYIYSIIGRGGVAISQPLTLLDCVVDGKIDSSRFLQYMLHSPEEYNTNKLIQSIFLDSDDESDDESDVESHDESHDESDDESEAESEYDSYEEESEDDDEAEMIREGADACVRGKVEGERWPLPLKKRSWEVVERGVDHPLVSKSLSQELDDEMIRKVSIGSTTPVTKKLRRA